ncbi:hypothetical protein Belba_2897 [Belliella baltica DSM 15883]|uniref:Outer membrane protein beta-barrel domain-containing protein n=1 Tax=Belliella baltica (strain DSM 15883 / CIP 108006 / LMG 21964 / BA134) TaxID=866536 RepID=I3Z860_BELBD|nr:hypothetical protein [Belliella baltica]AFL85428.1 hypothetical protein Belba_2897 [Belliella baltica DSM 15883]
MKKCLLLSFVLIISFQSFSQEAFQFKKGFIGISLGPSFYTGTALVNNFQNQGVPTSQTDPEISKGQIGFNINLLDIGYSFTENWGVVFKLQGGSQVSRSSGKVLKSTFGTFMIGPMYSVKIQEDLVLDMKIKGGRFFNVLTFNDEFGSSFSNSNFNFGMEAGVSLRYHFDQQFSWINNLDFQNQFEGNNENINRLNISTGIAFRF